MRVVLKAFFVSLATAGTELDVRGQLTLIELAKSRDPNGNLATIAEVLTQTEEFLDYAQWIAANGKTYHRITRRNSLPSGTAVKLNQGVDAESSTRTQVDEGIMMREGESKVDARMKKIEKDFNKFRAGEDSAFAVGLFQEAMADIMYGNAGTSPEKIDGFMTRLNDLSMNNVWDGGGSGSDVTSILVVQWGPTMVQMIYPENDPNAGVQHKDLGLQVVRDSNSKDYRAFISWFEFSYGIAVFDDRCVHRYANIEVSGATNTFDDDILLKILRKLPYKGMNAVIYANSDILTQMDIRVKDKANVNYSQANAFGSPVTLFRGIPVAQVDSILSTETAVS